MERDEVLAGIEARVGHVFGDRALLDRALTHRSWVEERYPGGAAPAHESQQRLEFLGDSVLTYVVGRWMYEELPRAGEGELTKRRAQVTKGAWLAAIGGRLELLPAIRLGRGEAANASNNRKLLEDTVEAIVGAVLLDGGIEAAAAVVRRWLPDEALASSPEDPISALNEWHQRRYRASLPEPSYEASGPDHRRVHTATVEVAGVTGRGQGGPKQEAKRAACADALRKLGVEGWA